MRFETVTSATNAKIRHLLTLQEKSRARREEGLFVVEGRRELGHCLDAGFIPRTVFVCGSILPAEDREQEEEVRVLHLQQLLMHLQRSPIVTMIVDSTRTRRPRRIMKRKRCGSGSSIAAAGRS